MNKDSLLTNFVSVVNKTNFSMGITLTVNGLTISGFLISYVDYLKESGVAFGQASDEHGIGKIIQGYFDRLVTEDSDHSDDGNDDDPHFIHLRNAVIIEGRNKINSPLWRGKLSSVDGFTVGLMPESE